ncbi:anti-repressor protein [Methylobacterium sp. GXF4]|uniref:Rha family transcriptional regulator n=1 Tax=Methylobacterium sp. GXF4 TaxID=1096546 RepID=UPI0002697CC7|nr:Rha family transcriptional regulator [Methylobacterium sp. GXF4]EIZ83628.1 anti-repressor protein [Methylobacterium sp. GXF4]
MTTAVTVFAREGHAYTDSRNVADVFEKAHSVVIRAVDELQRGLNKNVGTPWFVEKHERNPQNGQLYRYYEMTRDGASLLVMGFTGRKALAFKVAYIERFNEIKHPRKRVQFVL